MKSLNRRTFLASLSAMATLPILPSLRADTSEKSSLPVITDIPAYNGASGVQEATFYRTQHDGSVICDLCPHRCVIPDGYRGICGVRANVKGRLYSLVYGRLCSFSIDPIEKKPFFHYFPGSKTCSVATVGCNLACRYCNTWQLSQFRPEQIKSFSASPTDIVIEAQQATVQSISFTYTEPIIFYEYLEQIAQMAHQAGLGVTMVTAGYIEEAPLKRLLPLLSAVKVDLKAFSNTFYEKICSASLSPVLRTLEILKRSDVWIEIFLLLIPGKNDDVEQMTQLSRWIFKTLGPDVPIHISRFFPNYILTDLPKTPQKTLEQAIKIAQSEGLKFVYIGNVADHSDMHTRCPRCQFTLIERNGNEVLKNRLQQGSCPKCEMRIPGIW